LKNWLVNIFFSCLILNCNAQYYLRGEIKDERNENVPNVKIILHSDKLLYYSGSSGSFGISSTKEKDSLTFSLDGYESKTVSIVSNQFTTVILKALSSNSSKNRQKLISITKDQTFSTKYTWSISDESYFSLIENETVDAHKYPNTGFSLNVNKASYSNIRRFLSMKSMVPPDAVRLEELLNYFNLNYKEPEKNECFNITSQLAGCPWNEEKQLLFLNINARKIDLNNVPPSNLVFLIDASGSMDMPNRLPLIKAAFQMMVKNLRAIDTVSIVIYGGAVVVWMQPTSGAEKQKIIQSIEELTASGDTPGESGIRLAYQVAEGSFIKNGNNRVILATDGDFNVGETTEKALEELITRERHSGVYLTCLGVGMGNYKDSKLEALAKKGNGNYAYLDDIREAEKVLVKEVTQNFYTVADNVFLNVAFNPSRIKDYRLIGFDNKKDAIADSTGELEGGEIGSGNSVLAIFEITPVADSTSSNYSTLANDSFAEVTLRYIPVNKTEEKKLKHTCEGISSSFNSINKELQFGAALAMFGLKLRQSKYLPKDADWLTLQTIAANAHNPENYLQTAFLNMLESARKIYSKSKSRRKKMNED
jgi:Ca-activated chloride channel family protein